MTDHARTRTLLALPLALAALACDPPPPSLSGETGDEGGECPVGAEDCPCTDGGSCDAGLVCEPDGDAQKGVCVLEDPCPVGSLGCECTDGGGCDAGLACSDLGACGLEPGIDGNPCNPDGTCELGLDCVDGLSCEPPDPAAPLGAGWEEVRCGEQADYECYVGREGAWFQARRACEVAAAEAAGTITRRPLEWQGGCEAGEAIEASAEVWDDVACFDGPGSLAGCMARRGGAWVTIWDGCGVPAESTVEPWGPAYCGGSPSPSPAFSPDEWRCTEDFGCAALWGGVWPAVAPECALLGSDPWPTDAC